MSQHESTEQGDSAQIAGQLRDQARELIQKASHTPGSVGKRELFEAAGAALDAAWTAENGRRS